MEPRKMVLTAVGPDRPGLVHEIASAIHEGGANLEDSRMAILAGDFALIVLFSGTAEVIDRLTEKARDLERELDFQIRIKQATPAHAAGDFRPFEVVVTGVDQPGIIHRVSQVLAGLEVNVASLESRLIPAAFHGTPMFSLRAEIQLPAGRKPEDLAEQLEQVCDQMHLSCDLLPLQAE